MAASRGGALHALRGAAAFAVVSSLQLLASAVGRFGPARGPFAFELSAFALASCSNGTIAPNVARAASRPS